MSFFDDIANGFSFDGTYTTEAVSIDKLENMKLLTRQYTLPLGEPRGRGVIGYLYTNNIDESISLMKPKSTSRTNLKAITNYWFYYYNMIYTGKIYNKRFRYNLRKERPELYKKVENAVDIHPLKRLSIVESNNRNMYIDLSKYIDIVTSICYKISPRQFIAHYWNFIKPILNEEIKGYNQKFVLVDLKNFKMTKVIKENLCNPLFLIYYTLLINRDLISDLDIDFIFFNDMKVLKVNPSQCDEKAYVKLKQFMAKIMTGITPNETVNKAVDEENLGKEDIIADTSAKIISSIDKPSIITTDDQLKKMKMKSEVEVQITDKVSKSVEKISNILPPAGKDDVKSNLDNTSTSSSVDVFGNTNNDLHKTISDTLVKNIKDDIDTDRELIQKIYNEKKRREATIQKSAASTARDEYLRKNQRNIKIGNLTMDELLKTNTNDIPIPSTSISESISTSNKNLQEIKFDNVDTLYNREVIKKDIASAFNSLSDKSIPLFIRSIDIKDTSDELNYKDTYTIKFEDGNRQRHTLKVDIPKFIDDRFLYIGGNKKLIKHQSFFLPVVKVGSDKVEIVTNYSKMTLERVSNDLPSVNRMRKVIASNPKVKSMFRVGSTNNSDFITTLEYDQFARQFKSFECGNTIIYFDQEEATRVAKEKKLSIKENELFIGFKNGKKIVIDVDKQMTADNKTITEIILSSISPDDAISYSLIKASKRVMYARVKIMKQNMNVGMLLGLWCGLSDLFKRLGIEYRMVDKIRSSDEIAPDEEFITFKDCSIIYKQDISSALILNGIRSFNTDNYNIADFDSKEPYLEYIKKVYGKVIIENALMNFYEFVLDPITVEVLDQLNLPTNIVDLYIYSVKLLSDSQYKESINQNLYRIRCGEIIPAILYERLAKNYITFRNSNGRKKYTVPQNCVIKEILAQKTVEDYSILNPTLEMEMLHAVSTKGFRGINLDESYTIEKRAYDNSMIGILAPNTSPDGSVGVSRTLTLEPQVINMRGMIEDKHEKLDELKDTNLFSAGELTIPMAATIDDPNRLGHAIKQSKHVIPVTKSSPVLISNGMEEAARFHLTSNFVINADEAGVIEDFDPDCNIMIARYKSGKCRAIDLNPNIVKNGGGGFFLSNKLVTNLKVGDKFKKNDVLAYHKDFFSHSRFNNCRMNMGTLTKVAIMSTYNTYEDATFITHKMSQDCATEMVFNKPVSVGKNSNVFNMVKKGDHVQVGDTLIEFDTSYDDNSINALLASLNDDDKSNILSDSRNNVKSKYSGVIEDIKIYSTVDLDEMSPSLKAIVSKYYSSINKKKAFLNKYDDSPSDSIIKCGMLLNESTKKIEPNRFGVIKGEHVVDSVLIEFYIKHSEPLEVGSKIANFTALKNTIGEIIPEGYEPYSYYRPDEEVSTIIASNSILNRMTPSILITALGNKCIIELKRHLEEMKFDRPNMERLIYKFFSAFDKSGTNTKKYKELFSNMSDTAFKSYFKEFFADDNAYLILDVVDYEHTITMKDIEDAAAVIDVPLFEYVFLPHITMDKDKVICTKEKVPVGYINEKRTQQTVMKKNGMSTDITERSAITNQVTGKDKNGRESDLENTMLIAMGLKNTLKELNAPRADDSKMKQQMLRDISINGMTKLEDMDDSVDNKTTLNTVDAYYRCMGIQTDLVVKGLMLPKTLRDEL